MLLPFIKEELNILHRTKEKKADWIDHMMCRRYFLNTWIEGNRSKDRLEDKEEYIGSYRVALREMEVLEFDRGDTRPHSQENSLWKNLWTCRKTLYIMFNWTNEWVIIYCMLVCGKRSHLRDKWAGFSKIYYQLHATY